MNFHFLIGNKCKVKTTIDLGKEQLTCSVKVYSKCVVLSERKQKRVRENSQRKHRCEGVDDDSEKEDIRVTVNDQH